VGFLGSGIVWALPPWEVFFESSGRSRSEQSGRGVEDPLSVMMLTEFHQIAAYRLLVMRSGLRLEIQTGMRVSNRYNISDVVRKEIGSKTRIKAKLLGEFEEHLYKMGVIELDQFTR
jgi:hypothetical protein